ncbi:thiazole synthase [Halosquirtibacter laminarini]|uniref:Thiazole synthase n=1 Tax=Halosquirtibacter laminarini TaxID=3374600 RepID=A0AC61NMH2_9BACT|nr:thiazole synthase [Prolixibacteraceae bacterium]
MDPKNIIHNNQLTIANKSFRSRLFVGTGKYSSNEVMEESILASHSELVTMALKRVDLDKKGADDILKHLNHPHIHLLPNTSGVRDAEEAIFAAMMAREALGTNWVKLEIHPNPRHLLPDAFETVKASKQLVKEGFVVLPYIIADPITCKRLEEVGCQAVMPLASAIGTNQGVTNMQMLQYIIEQSNVPVIIDAGLGAPSHAAKAMEMGADACLVNTAIANSKDPVKMALAFHLAIESGRMAYESKLATSHTLNAKATSPLTSFLER